MSVIPQSEISTCSNPPGWQIVGDDYGSTKPLYRAADGWCKPFDYDGSVDQGIYGYDPSMAAGVAFFALFSLGTILYAWLTIRSRRWFLVVGVLFGLFEAIGWIGRLLSGIKNDFSASSRSKFLLQICCLTFAPAFASAAIYGIFIILVRLKPTISRISPKRLAQICIAIDVISLIAQAVGGGIAGSADTQSQADTGGYIMLAGIAFQLLSMLIFVAIASYYWVEQRRAPYEVVLPTGARPAFVWIGLAIASICVILRGAYRTAELSEGWDGYLNTTENFFLCLDALPMVICLFTLVATHLAFFLPPFEGRQTRLNSAPDSTIEKSVA